MTIPGESQPELEKFSLTLNAGQYKTLFCEIHVLFVPIRHEPDKCRIHALPHI